MSRCAACGRRLSRPSPSGLGPVCARRLGPAPRRPHAVRTTDPLPEIHPDQTALEFADYQPALTPTADRTSEEQQ